MADLLRTAALLLSLLAAAMMMVAVWRLGRVAGFGFLANGMAWFDRGRWPPGAAPHIRAALFWFAVFAAASLLLGLAGALA
jgi:hypothetical protein